MRSMGVALTLLFVVCGASLSARSREPRQQPQPQTVLDYYLILPSDMFRNYPLGEARAEREAAITLKDIKNGYLQLGKPGEGESASLALFKKPDGSYLLGMETTLCALKCEQTLYFLRYERGAWYDVTGDVLPKIDDSATEARVKRELKAAKIFGSDNYAYQLLYQLPRVGTTILVSENWSKRKVAELHWANGRFVVKPAR